jgi:PqqD family protein of HPr-rel-A system
VPLVRSWDDEHVLFHPGSGDTHLLDDDALRVLAALRAGPATAAQLAARLAPDQEAPAIAALALSLAADLAALGLLERDPA